MNTFLHDKIKKHSKLSHLKVLYHNDNVVIYEDVVHADSVEILVYLTPKHPLWKHCVDIGDINADTFKTVMGDSKNVIAFSNRMTKEYPKPRISRIRLTV